MGHRTALPSGNGGRRMTLSGHYRLVASRVQSWHRRAAERQVSGDESGPFFGLTRPVVDRRE